MPPVSWEPPTQPTGTCGDWSRRGLVHRRRWGQSCWQRWRGSSRMSRGPSSDGQKCWGHHHAMSTTTAWCPWCQREHPAVPRSGPLKCFTLSVKGNVTQCHIQTPTEMFHCQRECHTAPHSDYHWNVSSCQRECHTAPHSLPLKHFTLKVNVKWHHIQTLTETCQRKCQTAPHSESHWNWSPMITVKCQTALRSVFLFHCAVGIPVAWATFHHWWYA